LTEEYLPPAKIDAELRQRINQLKERMRSRIKGDKSEPVCLCGVKMIRQEHLEPDFFEPVNPWRCPNCGYMYIEYVNEMKVI